MAETHGTSAAYNGGCRCDDCRAAWATYMREWSARNKDKVSAARSRAWRSQTPEQRAERNAYLREYMRAHPEQREKANERRRQARSNPEFRKQEREKLYIAWSREPSKRALAYRKHWLKKQYGLTLEDFDAILERQGHACAICHREQVGMRMHVDHCHATGKVRGVLCSNCNAGLGLFSDNPDRLLAAIDYLSASRE